MGAGGGEYLGTWSRGSTHWHQVPNQEKERLGINHSPDPEFWYSILCILTVLGQQSHCIRVYCQQYTVKDFVMVLSFS